MYRSTNVATQTTKPHSLSLSVYVGQGAHCESGPNHPSRVVARHLLCHRIIVLPVLHSSLSSPQCHLTRGRHQQQHITGALYKVFSTRL